MYYNQNKPYKIQQQRMNSYIRVLHASPNAPSVDIYANGNMIANDLAYTELSEYFSVPSGNYNITVFPSGEMTDPVIDTDVTIPQNSILNVAAIGVLPDINLYPIPEPNTGFDNGDACVRFIHLSPDAPEVDIILPDGTVVFSDVGYMDITNYVCVSPETYSFDVTPAGTDNIVLTVPDVVLNENSYYSIYALGLVGETPELEAILVSEPRNGIPG